MRSYKTLKSRSYAFPNSTQQIILTKAALEVFLSNCQQGAASEAGGLLFAEFDFPIIRIVEASSPQTADKRWRTLFIPNRILQKKLINQRFKQGYHFVGEWHTHPVNKPTPSLLDLESMAESFIRSWHELNYFIMIIVGNTKKKTELWVSIHDGNNYYCLKEIS